MRKIKSFILPLLLLLLSLFLRYFVDKFKHVNDDLNLFLETVGSVLLIASIAWLIIAGIAKAKRIFLEQYDTSEVDNLRSRKFQTQFNILERILIFLIIIVAIGLILMLFQDVRRIGISLFRQGLQVL